jgi:hypothetical protein
MRVEVYWNLHRNLFSIRALSGPMKGRVIGHAHKVILEDVAFVVREAGRQRVLREKRKNVHAFVRSERLIYADWSDPLADGATAYFTHWHSHSDRMADVAKTYGTSVSYNPYKGASFVNYGTKQGHPYVHDIKVAPAALLHAVEVEGVRKGRIEAFDPFDAVRAA